MPEEEQIPECDHNCDPHTHDVRITEHYLDCPVWKKLLSINPDRKVWQ